MKLLFLTQVYDEQDAVLGFVPRWVAGLARECERVRVVALEVGEVGAQPANVDWRAVGRRGALLRYLRYRRYLAEAFAQGFDAVLAHMVPRYALVAAGPARRAGARLYLWYTHKAVDERLRRACARVDKVFTASAESMRVDTPRKCVTGHGIDLAHFAPRDSPARPARILSVGRLTPAKDPLTIVAALAQLRAQGVDCELDLVGGGLVASDAAYRERVLAAIREHGLEQHVHLHGAVPYARIAPLYARASVLVNSSHTGSVDKVVLEAMASERPVLSCNESFAEVFAPLGERAEALRFAPGDAAQLAQRARALLLLPEDERARLGRELRALVAQGHEVDALMARLVREMQPVAARAAASEGRRA